jgi:prefoldin subunit 5
LHGADELVDGLVPGLGDFFSPRLELLSQQRRIRELERQVSELQAQNDSMREGMRRCVTCEYRIDFKQRQGGEAPVATEIIDTD